MEVSELIQAISTVGFPIVMCLLFMYYIKYINDQHKDEIDKLSQSINNNTLVMQKLLDKLEDSGDRRGILWRPLICVQWKNTFNASYFFSKAESKLGLCEEYIHIRSLPIVVNLFIEEYEEYIPKPGGLRYSKGCILLPETLVFVARAYEHGWGVKKITKKPLR